MDASENKPGWRDTVESGAHDDANIEVLHELHAGRIALDSAAKRLESILFQNVEDRAEDSDEEEFLEDALTALWDAIFAYAIDYPSSQEKLVTLLEQLAALPDAAELNTPITDDKIVWREMPLVLGEFTDEWNYAVENLPKKEPNRSKAIDRWHEANRFGALLLKSSLDCLNTDIYALWTFRSALENEANSAAEKRNLDIDVPAAAIWITLVGDVIFGMEAEFPPGDGKSPGIGGPLWDGKHGFCRGRWDLWRRRFAEIAGLEGVSDSTRAWAEKAANAMERIESR